ncbi:MAG TPA: hypothetical protein VGW74_08955 [Propionibacteriaceae bacterium]|nr:hypothetical protein [Propionibacteriaceae bacterium]
MPWASSFPETNVRTYVCDRPGQSPLVHFSPEVKVRVGRWRFA